MSQSDNTEPCICARPIDLRSQAEIDAEIEHLYRLLALRLDKAGYERSAELVRLVYADWKPHRIIAVAPEAAPVAEAAGA